MDKNSYDELRALRDEIDALDKEITQLLVNRFTVAKNVAKLKSRKGLSLEKDETRETAILNNIKREVSKFSSSEDIIPYLEKLYLDLLDLSRKYQRSSL